MTPADLARIHADCFTTPRPWTAAEFADFVADSLCTLVTEGRDGFALIRTVAGEAELLTLAVAPARRREGLGRSILARAITTAAATAETMFLEVAADNTPALALYFGAGFTRSGRRPRYYHAPDGSRIDAILMTLPLASITG